MKRPRIALLLIILLALLVRIGAIVSIEHPQKVPRTMAESDAPTYYILAENLLKGIGYRYAADLEPTAKRTPGYPLLIAVTFKVFGRNFNALRAVQCMLDVVTTFLVFILSMLLFRNHSAAILAAIAYAIYPPAIISTTYVMTETLYAFLLAAFAISLMVALLDQTKSLALASGIILGLATLTRPVGLVLPLVLLVVATLAKPGSWKILVIMILGFFITLLPWASRNHRVFGKWIVTSTLVGANLYKGNHLPTQGAFFASTDSLLPPDLLERLSTADEATRDSVLREEALKGILANKKAIAKLTMKKVLRLWFNIGYGRKPSKKSILLAVAHAIMLATALYGLKSLLSDRKFPALVPLTIVTFSTLAYLAVASEVRFVFPLIPLLLPFSGAGLVSIVPKIQGEKNERSGN